MDPAITNLKFFCDEILVLNLKDQMRNTTGK